jgi:hypothetical protein
MFEIPSLEYICIISEMSIQNVRNIKLKYAKFLYKVMPSKLRWQYTYNVIITRCICSRFIVQTQVVQEGGVKPGVEARHQCLLTALTEVSRHPSLSGSQAGVVVVADDPVCVSELATEHLGVRGLPGPGAHCSHDAVVTKLHPSSRVTLPSYQTVLDSWNSGCIIHIIVIRRRYPVEVSGEHSSKQSSNTISKTLDSCRYDRLGAHVICNFVT